MTVSARIIADSISARGHRLTTFELTYPRMVHSELMTHRMFSRNAASSRAIPIQKMIEAVKNDPAMPVWWGRNQAGMQAREELSSAEIEEAKKLWLSARDDAVSWVEKMTVLGLHKQISNRVLEPWAHITVICSATEYQNWFKLRAHPDAQPEIAALARAMQKEYNWNEPIELKVGEWHTPFVDEDEQKNNDPATVLKISVARCARVSYVRQNEKRASGEDVAMADRLATSGHWSPFEHVAMCNDDDRYVGNFQGWNQYRKMFVDESGR